jgi:hypothetical protein
MEAKGKDEAVRRLLKFTKSPKQEAKCFRVKKGKRK